MKRRTFIKGATAAGVATAAVAASNFPKPAIASGVKEWKMVMSWPLNLPGLGTSGQRVARRIGELSEGKIKIKVYGGGELVPAMQVFDAVSKGDAEMYMSAEYYFQGKHKAFNFFTAVPYGMTGSETYSWMRYGGGQELWDKLSAQFNLKGFLGAPTGVQMGGWFRKEINSLDDFNGLKFRMPGIGGEVLRKLGVAVVNLPGGEVFPALQAGTIDGTEWVGPWFDMMLGFHKVAKYYYHPGFHEPGTTGSFNINKGLWDSLTKNEQLLIETVIQAEAMIQGAEFNARNNASLNVLMSKHGVKLRQFSNDILTKLGTLSGEVVAEIGNTDATSKEVYDSYLAFRKQSLSYTKISEQGFMNARSLPFKFG
jgi:TRAP-type mannitol/chloroaromatic compound transport system substrate-binding protein